MPDLNLIDDGSFEESPAQAAPPMKRKPYKKGGGGGIKILIIFIILALLGGTGYLLYQRGIIKLPFKKKQQQIQIPQEPIYEEPAEKAPDQKTDTSVALLENTPAIEEKTPAAKNGQEAVTEEGAEESSEEGEETTTPAVKLADMKGEYTVQVIAYREKSQAVETSKNLVDLGYPAFVEKVPMKGGDWYTVRVGRYLTPADAEKAVKNFAEDMREHYVIDKIRTK
jgi:cell division protein FtsN